MRIVIDTNVIASAIFFGGRPREAVELLLEKKIQAYANTEIIDEYIATVNYLKEKYTGKKVSIPLDYIVSACTVIETTTNVAASRDPDDDKFINCAIDSKSLYIVSGDKDLLSLEQWDGIEIITVGEFLNRYQKTL